MNRLRLWWSAEEGVAAIEAAVILLAFIFLIFTIMEIMYVLFAYNTVVRAAENAARYAMVHSATGCGALRTTVPTEGHVGVIPVTISVSQCQPPPSTCNTAAGATQETVGAIWVHAEYDFQSAGFFIGIFASTLPLKATVCVPLIS